MTASPPPDALRAPGQHLSADQARAVIAALEASTAHMRAGGDRALAGVIAWNAQRAATLRAELDQPEQEP